MNLLRDLSYKEEHQLGCVLPFNLFSESPMFSAYLILQHHSKIYQPIAIAHGRGRP